MLYSRQYFYLLSSYCLTFGVKRNFTGLEVSERCHFFSPSAEHRQINTVRIDIYLFVAFTLKQWVSFFVLFSFSNKCVNAFWVGLLTWSEIINENYFYGFFLCGVFFFLACCCNFKESRKMTLFSHFGWTFTIEPIKQEGLGCDSLKQNIYVLYIFIQLRCTKCNVSQVLDSNVRSHFFAWLPTLLNCFSWCHRSYLK